MRRRAGFTLIEVLAALVLIGVVLPVAMRGVSVALLTASKARHVGEATELARHKLTELSLLPSADGYDGSGDFGDEFRDYKWKSTSLPKEYGINEVAVEVTWKAQGVDQSLKLTTLTYPGAFVIGSTTAATPAGGTTP